MDLRRAYVALTEAQLNISRHRKDKHLCARCRQGKKCDQLVKLAILESHALAKWIDAYDDASNVNTTQALNGHGSDYRLSS